MTRIWRTLQSETWNTYLLTLMSLALAFFLPSDGIEYAGTMGFAILAGVAFFFQSWSILYVSLVFCFMSLHWIVWPLPIAQFPVHGVLLPVFLASLMVSFVHKPLLDWMKKGSLDLAILKVMIPIAIVSAVGLFIWAEWIAVHGYGEALVKDLRTIPVWGIALVGVPAFALLMALAEEILYRGILLQTFSQLTGSWWASQIVQATIYAAFHYAKAFPNGKVGFVMVFVYGVMLGELRKKSGGLLAPYLVHVSTDLVIGYYLIFRFL